MIDKLELLLALAKERHFGRAAEACGVTQPTMSTSIKQLEEFLGVMLVQRGSRFQGFTPEGERALDWARRIVGDARAMRQEINTLKEGLSGEIAIAAIPTALGMLASLTTPFRARHPNVRFRIISSTSITALALLENLEVDAGAELHRERADRQGAHHAALQRELSPADVAGGHVRRPQAGDVEGSGAGAAVPAHARHAEPPHHRSRAANPSASRRRRH